jgi:hypothetical protein
MPARTEKMQEPRSFSFRMPGDVFDDLSAVARARGVDISGVINWLLSEARPRLVQEKNEWEAEMLKAAKSSAWEDAETPEERLAELRKLLRKLEDEEDALAKRVRGRDGRKAA